MYIPFHRKYRPLSFTDLVGQEVISKILQREVLSNQIPNAYLFAGSRGCGKTSSARIVARALNCESPIGGNPCNVCNSCKLIIADKFPDVIEMDASSNSGVDNAKQLIENCKSGASYGKYKIYIIDEAHGLSKKAWDTLLKPIEEPLSTIKFIFCTTEIGKIPETISSRSQTFFFNRVSADNIVARLNEVCKIENETLDNELIIEIAIKADGSLRDSLVLLEQVLQIKDDKELIDRVLFRVSNKEIEEFLLLAELGDYTKTLSIINNLSIPEEYFINKVLHYLCGLFINKNDFFKRNGETKIKEILLHLESWKKALSRTISREVTNEFNNIILLNYFSNKSTIDSSDKEDFLTHVNKVTGRLSGKNEKVNNDNYLIITNRGAHLNVLKDGKIIDKGYYIEYPEGTTRLLGSELSPVELIKAGIIRRI